MMHGASKTIDWRLVGLLAAGSVPGTLVTLGFCRSQISTARAPARC